MWHSKRRPTTDAVEILHRRYFDGRTVRRAEPEEVHGNHDPARMVHILREKAGLTQAALAKRVDASASVIRRLEDADSEGFPLTMVRRIAAALNRRVEVRFISVARKPGITVEPKPKAFWAT